MANVQKFTTDDVATLLGHNGRTHVEYSNPDIDKSRSHLNYSFPMKHRGKDFDHFKKIVGENYLYGRGSKREADASTAASWVIPCANDILGDSEKEHAFFEGAFNFVSERYGPEYIINNSVHYDEGGLPHIHIMFVPVTEIDHDQIHFRTVKSKQAVRKESGRYEFGFKYKLDENGERIPLKNYAKMSDYYDKKISANDVLNKLELQHFHRDLQDYLDAHGIEGRVITGATGGTNYSIKDLKEFTQATGKTLNDIKDLDRSKPILQSFVEQQQKNVILEQTVKEKDTTISRLQTKVLNQETEIKKVTAERDASIRHNRTSELSEKLSEKETEIRQKDETIGKLQKDLSAEREKTRTLEAEKTAAVSNDRTSELSEKISKKDTEIHQKDKQITLLKTQVEGLREDVKEKDTEISSLRSQNAERGPLERSLDSKDKTIGHLQKELSEERTRNRTLEAEKAAAFSNDKTAELTKKLSENDRKLAIFETRNAELEQNVGSLNETINIKEQELDAKQKELDAALEKIKTLEAKKTKEVKEEATVKPTEKEETWGRDSSWESDSGWGNKDNGKTKNTEIIW